jgi:hypothetical protein
MRSTGQTKPVKPVCPNPLVCASGQTNAVNAQAVKPNRLYRAIGLRHWSNLGLTTRSSQTNAAIKPKHAISNQP